PDRPLIASPPVIQHPSGHGVTINFAVSSLATGWVQWGQTAEQLDQTAIAHEHGLISASDRALSIRLPLDDGKFAGQTLFYRVVAQPLAYKNAYQLERGETQSSPVYALRLPDPAAEEVTIAIVNDTHEQSQTLRALHDRLAAIDPDALVWN